MTGEKYYCDHCAFKKTCFLDEKYSKAMTVKNDLLPKLACNFYITVEEKSKFMYELLSK